MSEDNQGGNATPNESPNGDQGKQSVSYDTYRKVLGTLKKKEEMLSALEAKAMELENAQLAEQGKYKEMFEKLKAEQKQKEDDFKKKESLFVKHNLKNTVARYAKELGAIDGSVDDIYKVTDWSEIEFKEDYSVNEDQVKQKVSELTSQRPWYFKKQVSAPKDVVLGGNGSSGSTTDLSKLSYDELLKLAKSAK